MRRQMLAINLLLLVAALGLGIKLRADWTRANQRYSALETGRNQPALSSPVPGYARDAVAATDLDIIVRQNLFSLDRNNDLPKPAAERKAPPEPVLVGTLNLGSGKLALMAEAGAAAGGMTRQVKEGETFAGYKLVKIGDQEVTLEYEGQQKKVDVRTAVRQVPAPAAAAAAALPAAEPQVLNTRTVSPASAGPQTTSTASAPSTGVGPTGVMVPGTTSMLGHKDNLPAGTIVGNRIKRINETPFGQQVWWELIKPEEKKPEERKP